MSDFTGFDDGGAVEEEYDNVDELQKMIESERKLNEERINLKAETASKLMKTEIDLELKMKQDLIKLINIELEKGVLIDDLMEYENYSKKYLEN